MEIVTGHILFCDLRYWQFCYANGDDRAILVFSQRKPADLLRSVCLSVCYSVNCRIIVWEFNDVR